MGIAMSGEMRFLRAERFFSKDFEGYVSPKETLNAIKEYRLSAKKGHALAQFKYGYMLSRGLIGEANFKKGMKFIKKSARQGYPPAITELARGYYYGFGVQKNLKKAVSLWEKGAFMGISEASYYAGLAYFKGEGVKKDEKKAKKYFSMAKKGGFEAKF